MNQEQQIYKVDIPMSRLIGGVFWSLWLYTISALFILGTIWVIFAILAGVMIGAAS